ncbi:hypothetical protein PHMEG_00034743 [Phytophthora megakarya]|uniref:Uncharacterized protein n=1 Tax=Phytophthora megakarya TaxID=4795 RepID=A0A225UQN9_9STRA|nr:hypothetical protein PHMEG_00034743 [Phytophthora megakarya]
MSNSVVYVWCDLMEGQGDFSGYHIDETGWLRLRPEALALGKFFNSTTMEGYSRLVPFSVGGVPNDQFATIVAKTNEEQVDDVGRMLEKMLFDKPQLSHCESVCLTKETSDNCKSLTLRDLILSNLQQEMIYSKAGTGLHSDILRRS